MSNTIVGWATLIVLLLGAFALGSTGSFNPVSWWRVYQANLSLPQCGEDSEKGRLCCKAGFYAGKQDGHLACYERP